MTARTCRHCREEFYFRSGRGLCRQCWGNLLIRHKYSVVTDFGSPQATELSKSARILSARVDSLKDKG